MTPELSRRIAQAFAIGRPTLKERASIVDAVGDVERFEDLPASIRTLIIKLETGERR